MGNPGPFSLYKTGTPRSTSDQFEAISMRAAVTSVLIEPRLCWQVPKLDNWTRMLKQWIKQIIPARYRPYLLKFLSFYIRAADLPAAIRLKLTDRSRIVAANLARRDQR